MEKISRPPRKRFLCNLCSFKSNDREEMELHIDTFPCKLGRHTPKVLDIVVQAHNEDYARAIEEIEKEAEG